MFENTLQRASADNILRDLKANPDTWLQVVHILQNTSSTHTKFFALQVSVLVFSYTCSSLYLAFPLLYIMSHYIHSKEDSISILFSCLPSYNFRCWKVL